jgi:hypothetical protein
MSDRICFWALWKVLNQGDRNCPPEGQTKVWKALKPRAKSESVRSWAQRSQESIWGSVGDVGDGAGKRGMKCEMCTENDKEGSDWERQSQ